MTTPFDCHDANQRLVIALGDPAGIGMEVTLKALADPQRPAHINPLLVGCRASLERTAQLLRERTQAPVADPDDLEVDDQPIHGGPLEPGTAGSISGAASFQWLTRAVQLVQEGQGRALVTAPIAKYSHDLGLTDFNTHA